MMTIESDFSHWLFAQDCVFVAGSPNIESMPQFTLPEVAFVGRSNVGKSSLINVLTNRKALARVSHTPGRTKQLNFFSLADKVMLVDLPGYGYAKAPKKEVAGWNKLIYQYLQARPVLRRVFLLVDSRHGLKPSDESVMNLLDEVAVNYQIILTKSDKSTKEDIDKISLDIRSLAPKHSAMHPEILVTSSRFKSEGIKQIHDEIASFA
jgi:GTP-binding protein